MTTPTALIRSAKSKPRTPTDWPRKVKWGRITVTVYRRKTPAGNFSYQVANYSGGRRRMDSYPTEKQAIEAAKTLADQMAGGQQLAARLSNDDAAEYMALRKAAGGHELLELVTHAVSAVDLLGGDISKLTEIARLHNERESRITCEAGVADAVEEYVAAKQNEGRRPRTITDIRQRLRRFADAFRCHVSAVSTPDISDWLNKLGTGPVDRRNYLVHLGTFFDWCGERGYVVAGENPANRIKRPKINKEAEPSIYQPEQLLRLLKAASSGYRPILALMAFAGLRPTEAQRLRWDNIRWDDGHLVVDGRGAKTASRRLVPILDGLRAWIPTPRAAGPVWAMSEKTLARARIVTAKQSGVSWLPDGLRHTWISARVAVIESVAKVAGEAGNSEAVIHQHYRALMSKDAAERWFAVRPPGSTDTQMAEAANRPS